MIELYIIKSILNNIIYKEYSYILDERFLHEENEEISLIYQAIKDFYKSSPPDTSVESVDRLEQLFHAAYPALPKKKRDLYSPLFDRLRSIELDPAQIAEYYSKLRNKHELRKLAEVSLQAALGKISYEKVKEIYDRINQQGTSSTDNSRGNFLWSRGLGSDNLNRHSEDQSGILSFRNQTLQRSIGPLRKGDFGLVFARPEVGKTAFMVDCAAFMATQVPTRVVYLANEERGAALLARLVSSYTGKPRRELPVEGLGELYDEIFKEKLILLHEPSLNYKDFYAFLREAKPELILIDQLDKVQGFEEDRYDLELGKIYFWARQMAAEFGTVIAASQASDSAEGKRWLHQNDLANSKTSKPAEVDWLLGIGKTHEEALRNIRHFHIIKNKLEGDEQTIEEYRHGKFDMLFQSEISRYEDTMKWEK